MIKQITKAEIKTLVDQEPEICVSIFMPVLKAGSEGRQNPIRFKNLISKAGDRLCTSGLSVTDAERILMPAEDITNNELFWQKQLDSFVACCSRKFSAFYSLNFSVEEQVVVGNRFYIKPLLPLLMEDTEFYVMALSKNHIRLLSCNSFTYEDVEVKNIPKNMKEAMRFNDPERGPAKSYEHSAHSGGTSCCDFSRSWCGYR